ncbi:type III secretion system HrpP C-terminal domain-containing protein [Enterobacteriaceae bacterium]
MSALPQAREAGKEPLPQRPSVARERPTPQASDAAPADRKGKSTPVKQDASLFDALLGQPETGLLPAGVPLTATAWPWLQAPDTSAPETVASPARVWQQIEPALCTAVEKQPAGAVAMTLLLPKLGEVDARLSAAGNGWDINLRFAPQAMLMMAPHQERCRESLRRRMACQVRLRFEQRGQA